MRAEFALTCHVYNRGRRPRDKCESKCSGWRHCRWSWWSSHSRFVLSSLGRACQSFNPRPVSFLFFRQWKPLHPPGKCSRDNLHCRWWLPADAGLHRQYGCDAREAEWTHAYRSGPRRQLDHCRQDVLFPPGAWLHAIRKVSNGFISTIAGVITSLGACRVEALSCNRVHCRFYMAGYTGDGGVKTAASTSHIASPSTL